MAEGDICPFSQLKKTIKENIEQFKFFILNTIPKKRKVNQTKIIMASFFYVLKKLWWKKHKITSYPSLYVVIS